MQLGIKPILAIYARWGMAGLDLVALAPQELIRSIGMTMQDELPSLDYNRLTLVRKSLRMGCESVDPYVNQRRRIFSAIMSGNNAALESVLSSESRYYLAQGFIPFIKEKERANASKSNRR